MVTLTSYDAALAAAPTRPESPIDVVDDSSDVTAVPPGGEPARKLGLVEKVARRGQLPGRPEHRQIE